jgi:uncharacterized protein (UPF0548 family)
MDDLKGQIFALIVLTVAAAESAIGLAILVSFYRLRGTVSILFECCLLRFLNKPNSYIFVYSFVDNHKKTISVF